jgi:hypothetical protein
MLKVNKKIFAVRVAVRVAVRIKDKNISIRNGIIQQ